MNKRKQNSINLINQNFESEKKTKGASFLYNLYLKFQELGRALLFPITTLPIIALFLKIGALLISNSAASSWSWWLGQIFYLPSNIIFANLGIIFCVGVSFGLSKDRRGEAALASLIGILALNALSGQFDFRVHSTDPTTTSFTLTQFIYGDNIFYKFNPTGNAPLNPKDILDSGVFGGLVIGCWTAFIYNKFSNKKLHPVLMIFSGRRLVPMIVFISVIGWGILFAIAWVWIAYAFYSFGSWLTNIYSSSSATALTPAVIAGAFGFINKLLLPFGLNNIISAPFWYQIPFTDAGGNSWNGDISAFIHRVHGSGVFQTGFFIPSLFGLPAAAIAMILLSDIKNRKATAGLLGGAAVVSFFSGVTEPLEYSFLYVAPLLFGVHAIFTAIGSFLIILCKVYVGFGFRPGILDYISSYPISMQLSLEGQWFSPLIIFPIGILMGLLYFGAFYFLIKKLNLPTLGRGNTSYALTSLSDNENNQNPKNKHSLPNIHLPM